MKSLPILAALSASMTAVMANAVPQASNSLPATPASSFAAPSSVASGAADPTESDMSIGPTVASFNNGSALSLPTFFSWDGPVVQSGWEHGLAVEGFTHLTIRQDGTYTFTGHLTPIDFIPTWHLTTTWTITARGGVVYHFVYPDEPTERCDVFSNGIGFGVCDWKVNDSDVDIKNNWENIVNGVYSWGVAAHR